MVHKKGPLRGLSIVVDPTHRLITDDSDKVRGGRVVLDGGNGGFVPTQGTAPASDASSLSKRPSAIVPPSPAPGASFGIQQQRPLPPPLYTSSASTSSLHPAVNWTATDPAAPPSDSIARSNGHADVLPAFRLPPSISIDVAPSPSSSSPSPILPQTTSFSQALAARRRSSVVSLPSLPRSRNSSTTTRHKRTSSGRAEEDGFSYLNSAASQSTLSSVSMPAPYQNGPIQVLPGIWLGCEENARDWESLKRCNIGSILNVAKEISTIFGEQQQQAPQSTNLAPPPPAPRVRSSASTPNLTKFSPQPSPRSAETAAALPKFNATFHPADSATGRPDLYYLHLPWSHGQSDLVANGFPQAFAFADESIKRGKGVLVHCQCGVSRSATLVIAMVMRAASQPDATEELQKLGKSMHNAYEFVREKSVCIGPNMSLIYQLMEYEKSLHPPRHFPQQTSSSAEASPVTADSEEERIRAEEEQWAKMRREMEEEEERERQESLRAAGVVSMPALSEKVPVMPSAPWASTTSWTASSSVSQQDEEEAMNLDRAMEERLVARRKASPSPSSITSTSGNANNGQQQQVPNWRSRFGGGHRRVRAGSVAGSSISMHSVEEEDEGEGEKPTGPGPLRSRTTSSTTSSSAVSRLRLSITSSDDLPTSEPDQEQPLSANTSSSANDVTTSASIASPLTPAHMDTSGGNVQVAGQQQEIVIPLPPRLLGAGMAMNLDSPISPAPRRLPFGKRSFTAADAPPSASPFKLSFDHAPIPNASYDLPPPSASHFRTSFGEQAFPPPSSEAGVPFPSGPPKGFGLGLPFKNKRAKKSASGSISSATSTSLETVPHSPPIARSPSRSFLGSLGASLERRSSSSSLKSIKLLERSRSPSPPTVGVDLVNAEPEIQAPPRKRTKSKVPAPLALQSNQPPQPSYMLSSGQRSTSSSSISSHSSSSSSSAGRLKNKLLGRVARAAPPSTNNSSSASTPHQTLFIFPPSPTKPANVPAGAATPSAMMLTTSYSGDSSASTSNSTSIPMLSPTPTLATFMHNSHQRRGISRKTSSSSSASASSSSGGWLGGTPATPTTACARVDARGWVAR